jgi:hypothetical protein
MRMSFWAGRIRAIGNRVPAEMFRTKSDRDNLALRAVDGIDELFGAASPNPARTGCPERKILIAAANRSLPMDHEVYDHLGECSECYREFRSVQQSDVRRFSVRPVLKVAAVLIAAVFGGAFAIRSLVPVPLNGGPASVVLDFRTEGINRSDAGQAVRKVRMLPRKNMTATILMPTGSEPGQYELRVVDQSGRTWLSQAATGTMENFAVKLTTNLNLRPLQTGSYFLETRGVDEDWEAHPIKIE